MVIRLCSYYVCEQLNNTLCFGSLCRYKGDLFFTNLKVIFFTEQSQLNQNFGKKLLLVVYDST